MANETKPEIFLGIFSTTKTNFAILNVIKKFKPFLSPISRHYDVFISALTLTGTLTLEILPELFPPGFSM